MESGTDGGGKGFRWLNEYEKTWEEIQEDDEGTLQASIDDIIHKAKRKRLLIRKGNVRLGMMRHLFIILDMSKSMKEADLLHPSRLACVSKILEDFIIEYFYQNPISQLGLIATKDKRGEKLTDLSGNPKSHVKALKEAVSKAPIGEASLQNSLYIALESLKHLPSHASREVLIIYGSLTSCDPGDIFQTIEELKKQNIRCSIIGLSAEIKLCKTLCSETKGLYNDRRQHNNFRSHALYPAVAFLDSDAAIWNFHNSLTAQKCARGGGWPLFYDHDATKTALSGQTAFNSEDAGIALWHEGWSTNDLFIASHERVNFPADHNTAANSHFAIWRNDDWVVDYPRFYYGSAEAEHNWLNGSLAYGGFGKMAEASGQMGYESGSDFMYHSGVTSGFYQNAGSGDPVPPFIDENSTQKLFRLNSDGSMTLFHYNRVRGCKPSDNDCMSTGWEYDVRMDHYMGKQRAMAIAAGFKHEFSINTDTNPTEASPLWTWTANNGDNLELYSFVDSVATREADFSSEGYCVDDYHFCGFTGDNNYNTNSETTGSFQLRITTPATAVGHTLYPMLNVISIDDSAPAFTYTEILDNSGNEDVQGGMVETSTERVVALFSSDDKVPSFTSAEDVSVNYKATYDPQRKSKAVDMSKFIEGSTVQFTIDDTVDMDVFIMGIDTDLSWTFTSNDGAETCANTLATAGVCRFTVSDNSTTQNITWAESGASPPDCDDQCALCTTNEAQCDASAQTCYWHDNDGTTSSQCNNTQADSTLCAAGDLSKCNQSTCESNTWCWESNMCQLTCTQPPAEFSSTIYATTDIMIESGSNVDTNLDTTGLGATTSTASSFSIGQTCNGSCDNCDSKTVSCTVTTCNNQIMIAHVATEENGDNTPNSVTWNGDTMTLGHADSYWLGEKSSLYYLLNPDDVTGDLVATFDSSSSVDIILGMTTACGLAQQAPEAVCNGEDSCSITTVTDGAFLISGISNVTSSTNTVAGEIDTKVYDKSTPAWGTNATFAYGLAPSAGAATCGFTNTISGGRSGTACLSFEVSTSESGTNQASCFDFDTSTLPDTLVVRSVDLNLVVSAEATGTGSLGAFKGLRSWVEAQATWNIFSTGNSWETEGGKGSADIDGNAITGSGAYSTFNITNETTADTVTLAGGTSFITYVDDNTAAAESINICIQQYGTESSITFYDVENGTEANRPNIFVTYDTDDFIEPPVVLPTRTMGGGKYFGRWGN